MNKRNIGEELIKINKTNLTDNPNLESLIRDVRKGILARREYNDRSTGHSDYTNNDTGDHTDIAGKYISCEDKNEPTHSDVSEGRGGHDTRRHSHSDSGGYGEDDHEDSGHGDTYTDMTR